ncbi:MAG: hypothetical protein IPP36_10930 [Nitrosomonadales bacterium]|nr:hypothetical protein [Nitrosomonadales bacterium]
MNRRDEDVDERGDNKDNLVPLPSNPKPTLLAPEQGLGLYTIAPANALIRRYYVSAVLANTVFGQTAWHQYPQRPRTSLNDAGGTLVYKPMCSTISIQTTNEDGNPTTHEFGAGLLHDPTAIMFVRNKDIDPATGKIRPGHPVEPVVIRAAAGRRMQGDVVQPFAKIQKRDA